MKLAWYQGQVPSLCLGIEHGNTRDPAYRHPSCLYPRNDGAEPGALRTAHCGSARCVQPVDPLLGDGGVDLALIPIPLLGSICCSTVQWRDCLSGAAWSPPAFRIDVSRVLFLALGTLLLSACADDSVEWQVTVVVSDTSLTSGSAQTTEILVSVLDQDRNPPPQGTVVRMQCINLTAGDLVGLLGTTQPGIGQETTDTVGIARFEFTCGEDAALDTQVVCRASYEGVTTNGSPITCSPAP